MQFNVGFTPVSITLSSQAEVDFFYTLLANAPDTLVGDFGLAEEVDELTAMLEMEASDLCFPEEYMDVEDFYPPLDEPVEDFCQGCAGCNTKVSEGNYQHKPQRIEQPMQREHPCKSGCEACVGCNCTDSNYEAEKPTFQPFQINSQEEADILKALLGGCTGSVDSKFGANTMDMYQRIKHVNDNYGSLTVELNYN